MWERLEHQQKMFFLYVYYTAGRRNIQAKSLFAAERGRARRGNGAGRGWDFRTPGLLMI